MPTPTWWKGDAEDRQGPDRPRLREQRHRPGPRHPLPPPERHAAGPPLRHRQGRMDHAAGDQGRRDRPRHRPGLLPRAQGPGPRARRRGPLLRRGEERLVAAQGQGADGAVPQHRQVQPRGQVGDLRRRQRQQGPAPPGRPGQHHAAQGRAVRHPHQQHGDGHRPGQRRPARPEHGGQGQVPRPGREEERMAAAARRADRRGRHGADRRARRHPVSSPIGRRRCFCTSTREADS